MLANVAQRALPLRMRCDCDWLCDWLELDWRSLSRSTAIESAVRLSIFNEIFAAYSDSALTALDRAATAQLRVQLEKRSLIACSPAYSIQC
jgi:hypothetical protein